MMMNRLNIKRTVGSCLMAMAFFSCTHTDQTPTKDFVRLCKSIYRQYQPSAGAYLPNRTSAELDAQGLSGKGRLYIGQGKRTSGGGDPVIEAARLLT